MQAIILAAGKSTRTYPLTLTKPKPLLKAANKTILEYNLGAIKDLVDELIIVIGYKKNMIKKFVSKNYPNLNVKYVEQKEQLGTAHALSITEPFIKGRFILMMGDDIYSKGNIKKCIKNRYSILTTKVKDPKNFGVIIEKNNLLVDFIEKPKKFISNLANTAFYSLDKQIFHYIKKIKKSKRKEFELPDAIKLLSKKEKIHIIKTKRWFPIGYPWDLLIADKDLRSNKNLIGKNSKINGTIKNSTIGNNCIIDGKIKNSIIMDNTLIEKGSIVENSIIGENVYFKGKIISKNNVFSIVKNKKIKVNKLGAIIADNVKADNVVINPGCKIWPDKEIKGEVKKDIK